jgi:hypothetical protein
MDSTRKTNGVLSTCTFIGGGGGGGSETLLYKFSRAKVYQVWTLLQYADKKERKISSYMRKFRWDRLQSHI